MSPAGLPDYPDESRMNPDSPRMAHPAVSPVREPVVLNMLNTSGPELGPAKDQPGSPGLTNDEPRTTPGSPQITSGALGLGPTVPVLVKVYPGENVPVLRGDPWIFEGVVHEGFVTVSIRLFMDAPGLTIRGDPASEPGQWDLDFKPWSVCKRT